MEALVRLAQDAVRNRPGVTPVWTLDVHVPPDGREQFGFKDSISEPAVEGTDILGSNPHEAPLKAGEFVLGYQDETGDVSPGSAAGGAGPQRHVRGLPQAAPAGGGLPPVPGPECRGRRRAGVACGQVRRRWPSGAPLALAPDKDDPNWAPIRTEQRLHVRRRPAGSQVPGRRARPEDERTRRGHHRTVRACTA
jgi:deferrochelatase/peroxidase EfeB